VADRLTSRRIARRARIKDWVLPLVGAGVGLFLEVAFNWRPIVAVKHVFEGIVAVGASFFGSHAATKGSQMLYGFAGPITGFWLGFLAPKPLRRLLDQIPGLRDPPPFTRIDLDAEEDRPFRHSGWTKPAFIGRDEEKAELVGWAVEPGPPFRWRGLIGRSGTGKTRLALHWLAEMDRRRWDAGLVDPEYPIAEGWHARRPTALVVDEAQLFWDRRLGKTLDALYAGTSEKAPLRILVLNMTEPTLESRDSEHLRIVEAMRTVSLRLTPFDDEASRSLWREATKAQPDLADRAFDAAGLPNAIIRTAHGALEGRPTSYQAELTGNVVKMMPKLADNAQPVLDIADCAELKIVAFAAMAGPLDWQAARDAYGEFGRRDLRPILPDADLDRGIPVIAPEDLRLELLLRCLALLGEHDSLPTIQAAIRANANAVEVTLGSLWADRAERSAALELYHNQRTANHDHAVLERAACVVRMQRLFDDLEPDRGSRAVAEAGELAALSGASGLPAAEVARITGNLDDIVDRRPFDPAIRLEEAKAAINSIAHDGGAGEWQALERWGERLGNLVQTPPFDRDPAIRLAEAKAAVNAIAHYGGADEWQALERWGERLGNLVRIPPFDRDPAIRLAEAEAAFNAITRYGGAGEWQALERWGERLGILVQTPPFDRDAAIRLAEAEAAFNAIAHYGGADEWQALVARRSG
jgi:hypothetical protein